MGMTLGQHAELSRQGDSHWTKPRPPTANGALTRASGDVAEEESIKTLTSANRSSLSIGRSVFAGAIGREGARGRSRSDGLTNLAS